MNIQKASIRVSIKRYKAKRVVHVRLESALPLQQNYQASLIDVFEAIFSGK